MDVISKKDAIEQGLKHYYTGKPCIHGHYSKRQVSDRSCVLCKKARTKANPEYIKAYRKKYYAKEENRQRHLDNCKKRNQEDPEYREILRKANLRYRKIHPGREALLRKERYQNDPEFRSRVIQHSKNFAKRHPEIVNEKSRKNHKKYCKELTDSYIASALCKKGSPLNVEDIPQTLIDAKRAELKLKRKLKNEQTK